MLSSSTSIQSMNWIKRSCSSFLFSLALLSILQSTSTVVLAANVVLSPLNPTAGNIQLQRFNTDANGLLAGAIWVNNLSFNKVLRVFYSNPTGTGWSTTNFIQANYASSGTNNQELWTFSGSNPAFIAPGTNFYIQYTVAGTNYYDNNANTNYRVPAVPVVSIALNPAVPSTDPVKLTSYAFDGTSSLSARIWVRNIAFTKVVTLTVTHPTTGQTVSAPASYLSTSTNGYEAWSVNAAAAGAFVTGSRIAVSYIVNGVTYNDGPYTAPASGAPELPVSTTTTVTTTTTTATPTSTTVVVPTSTTVVVPTSTTTITAPPTLTTTTTTATVVVPTSSTAIITTTTIAPPVIPTFTSTVRPHPEGPRNQAVLLESYAYDPTTNTLAGGVWIRPGATPLLEIVCSNKVGLFSTTTTTITGRFDSKSLVPGYDYWKFEGRPSDGGAGMMFFLKYTASGVVTFDSNGGPNFNYRVDFPKFVPAGWKGRSIYQLMTDRFSRATEDNSFCDFNTILNNYCGGKWRGIINKLDYIQNMGFDAIWISSVIDNTPGGYHGYWPRDFLKINGAFGAEQDLRDLIAAAHARDMLVMIDTVPNHVGPLNGNAPNQYPAPLNKASNYHSPCDINYSANPPQSTMEFCRLNPVNPDLNTEDGETVEHLLKGMRFVDGFGADGYRLDAVRHVRMDFWPGYVAAAGNKFCMGEVAQSFTPYVGAYQRVMASLQGYPTYSAIIRNVFVNKTPMKTIDDQTFYNGEAFTDVTVLGNFIDNQDQDRFLKLQPDQSLYRNALAYILFADGIPNIYQGTEQAYSDGGEYRRPVWDSGFNSMPSAGIYQWLSVMQKARRDIGREIFVNARAVKAGPANPTNTYVIARKPFLIALTNSGSGVSTTVRVAASFGDNKVLRNVLTPADTIAPGADGFYTIALNGDPKVYV